MGFYQNTKNIPLENIEIILSPRRELISYNSALRFFTDRDCFNQLTKEMFVGKIKLFEILTNEYIEDLTCYLVNRINKLIDQQITILEAGAGDGRLTFFVNQKLQRYSQKEVKMIAIDNGQRGIKPLYRIINYDYQEALERFKPQIVLSSWMPMGVDWTKDFRKTISVMEYILIGPKDNGFSGAYYETWGQGKNIKLYEIDGFERLDLENLNQRQLCFENFKYEPLNNLAKKFSHTVSFRRKNF